MAPAWQEITSHAAQKSLAVMWRAPRAATPPSSVMKSRRFMGLTPRPTITELSIAGFAVGLVARIATKSGPLMSGDEIDALIAPA